MVSTIRDPPSRRRSRDTPHTPLKVKRINNLLFVGDSLLKRIAYDENSNAEAWERGWKLRFKRGGYIRDIDKMLQAPVVQQKSLAKQRRDFGLEYAACPRDEHEFRIMALQYDELWTNAPASLVPEGSRSDSSSNDTIDDLISQI
jgi:hypothetical protein